jgi:hypothetical protein
LIRAFNTDVPYDRLVREHLAGDLLAPRWNKELGINEAPIGTAFYRFVELYSTPVDPKNEENNVAELQIDTLGKTFQGLTLACARCHDHKFDPISARDYHALYGILASSRVTMHVLDAPERLHALDADLRRAKERVRGELVKVWRDELARWPERFADEPWRKAIKAAAIPPMCCILCRRHSRPRPGAPSSSAGAIPTARLIAGSSTARPAPGMVGMRKAPWPRRVRLAISLCNPPGRRSSLGSIRAAAIPIW